MATDNNPGRLTFSELLQIDALITSAQERGLALDEVVKTTEEISCCGAVTATARGKFTFTDRDQEILREMRTLALQLEAAPTLADLIDARGELLREGNG